MSISEKYELVRQIDGQRSLVRQKRLGREVLMHRLALDGLEPTARISQRRVASQLADIDHPAVPHVIDFLQHRDAYCLLVTESSLTNRWQTQRPRGLLERLQLLGQVVEAINSAHRRGIGHGNIDAEAWLIDRQGKARILDLGVQQLLQSEVAFGQLRQHDLECVLDLVEGELQSDHPPQVGLDHGAEKQVATDGSDDAEHCRLDALQKIIATQRNDNSAAGFAEFAGQFQGWLDAESMAAERRMLTFSASDEATGVSGWSRLSLVAACVAFLGVVVLVLTTVFWPQTPALIDPQASSAELGPNYEAIEPTVSALQTVGAINQSIAGMEEANKHEIKVKPKSVADVVTEDMTGAALTALPTADALEMATTDLPMFEAQGDRVMSADLVRDAEATSNPFQRLASALDLPAPDVSQASRLISIDLGGDDSFGMQLLGGVGAFKQGEFRIEARSSEPHAWSVVFEKAAPVTIARCALVDGELQFQWSGKATSLPAASYLKNCLLELESGTWRHTLALRTPQVLSSIQVDLERVRPWSMAIPAMPSLDNVYVEFVPTAASLAEALPSNVMAARGGKMKVGLDAGRDSLFVLDLESRLDRRRLRNQPIARVSSTAPFVPIKKGAARKLHGQLRSTAVGLARREAYVKTVKGEGSAAIKKRLKGEIATLKSNLKRLTFFAESYAIATNTRLEFRIYRRVAEQELELARFVTPSDE